MSERKSILAIIRTFNPHIYPDEALYGLYRECNSNCSAVARLIAAQTGVSVSPSAIWRHIERIKKDRQINGNGNHT